MLRKPSRVWTPEKAIVQIPEYGVRNSRLFLRKSAHADNKAFTDAVLPLLPKTPNPNHDDASSFLQYIGDLADRRDSLNRILLAVIEATVVIKAQTCVTALRDGLKIANPENQLQERVIPIVVVDEQLAHTQFEKASTRNPDGPRQVLEQARLFGAIALPVTPETLRERVSDALHEILRGKVPQSYSAD